MTNVVALKQHKFGFYSYTGDGNGNPLQCSCLENCMDRGAWRAAVHGVARAGHDWVTDHSTQSHRLEDWQLPLGRNQFVSRLCTFLKALWENPSPCFLQQGWLLEALHRTHNPWSSGLLFLVLVPRNNDDRLFTECFLCTLLSKFYVLSHHPSKQPYIR